MEDEKIQNIEQIESELHLNSYDERLYETIDEVDPCPYCGCDRIVIRHYNSYYEHPVEYTVEHVDEKEAILEDCYEMYYAFKSKQLAIDHANHLISVIDNDKNFKEIQILNKYVTELESIVQDMWDYIQTQKQDNETFENFKTRLDAIKIYV